MIVQEDGCTRPFLKRLTHPHDRVGIRIRERPQQHAVDDAEHRGVGADAECEGRQRRQRERALPGERAHGVADVSQEGIHGVVSSVSRIGRWPDSLPASIRHLRLPDGLAPDIGGSFPVLNHAWTSAGRDTVG